VPKSLDPRRFGSIHVSLEPGLPVLAGHLVEEPHQVAGRSPFVAAVLDEGAQQGKEVAVSFRFSSAVAGELLVEGVKH